MATFTGFPDGALAATAIPNLFFSHLLPQIDSLAELQITLHVFWRTAPGPRAHAWIASEELRLDPLLLDALAQEPGGAVAAIADGVRRAVDRGGLLRATVRYADVERDVLAPNTTRGRRGLATLRGRAASEPAPALAHPPASRPAESQVDIFTLYEQNIGLLQPMIADELRAAAELYPAAWIDDAFRLAVTYNKRNWRYVKRILERWATDGRDRDAAPRTSVAPGSRSTPRREWVQTYQPGARLPDL